MFQSRSKKHLIHKLYSRELWGQFSRGKLISCRPARQLFDSVPSRLIFPLSSTIPNIGNHILMGATKCGKFLLTYTFTVDSINSILELSPCYRYRLHFWSFTPGRQATKVAEVQLFDNSVVTEILTIIIVQWPTVPNRIAIFGQGTSLVEDSEDLEERCKLYVTITTTPNPTCMDCRAVAASFDEEEMAANWNTGVGLTCGQHGLTFHTWFLVPDQSHFDPDISCASDSKVVVRTGSFIHVVEFNSCDAPASTDSAMDSLRTYLSSPTHQHSVETLSPAPSQDAAKSPTVEIVNAPLQNRLSYRFLMDSTYMILVSDSWVNKIISLLMKWINIGNRIEVKELPFYLKIAIQKHYELNLRNMKSPVLSSSNVLGRLYSRYLTPRPKWFSSDKTNRLSYYAIKKRPKEGPDKVYDFEEERVESCTKFEAFRRHCLANKVYEFRSDEERNVENIEPGSKLRHRSSRRQLSLMNDESCREEGDVARFMAGLSRDSRHRRRKLRPQYGRTSHNSTAPVLDSSLFELSDEVRKVMSEGFGHQPVPKCSMRFKRTYVETDREVQSSVTDLDDEEVGFLGFPCHLPMSVHGAAYAQMQRISNQRVDRMNVWCAEVVQSSLDIEAICHVAGEHVCHAENFKFNYFVDYDTEIIQVCPTSGEVLIILMIRLSADNLRVKETTDKTDTDGRKKRLYDCQVLIVWSPVSRICYLEGYSCLSESSPGVDYDAWASLEAVRLRHLIKSTFGFGVPNYTSLVHKASSSGEQLVSGSLIIDRDNLIGFKKTTDASRHSAHL